jgi:lipoprotein-releasing system permease protein
MGTLLKIAWRNIWRNKTRTLLTACAVFISVVLTIIMTSSQFGSYEKMIENVVQITGDLQIQHQAYKENKSINESVLLDTVLIKKIQKLDHIAGVTSHLESFALASSKEMTKGVMVIGIIPSDEDGFSNLRKKLSKTTNAPENYLSDSDEGILLGEKLATLLKIGVRDTLVLISQGYHGISAAGLFHVRGFIRLPSVEMESSIVYMTLPSAQRFYAAEGLGTSILIKADNPSNSDLLAGQISSILPPQNCIKSWQDISPEIVQMIESDVSSSYFMKGILYMIITFIIFSTLVMMMHERRKEFGIIHAIGMQKFKLSGIVFFELMMISLLGSFVGVAIGYLIVYRLNLNPIPLQGDMARMMEEYGFEPALFFSANADIFYWQPVIIFVLTILLYIFPLITIKKLNIIKAIRG